MHCTVGQKDTIQHVGRVVSLEFWVLPSKQTKLPLHCGKKRHAKFNSTCTLLNLLIIEFQNVKAAAFSTSFKSTNFKPLS